MSVKLLALRSGFTTLTVTYQYNDIILKAAITVGSYHALKVSTNKELDWLVRLKIVLNVF